MMSMKRSHDPIYRLILELMARFGYVSVEEIIYGLGGQAQRICRRLDLLERAGFIKRFPSLTRPAEFFCLRAQGRRLCQLWGVSDTVADFVPSHYNALLQLHSRLIIKSYLGLRRLFGPDFQGWVSESTLRREGGDRIFDGEFFVDMRLHLQPAGEIMTERWRWGFELELSLKTPGQYEKQFDGLAWQVYDALRREQTIPALVFLCGSPPIFNRLLTHALRLPNEVGQCLFFFALAAEFFDRSADCPVVKVLRGQTTTIPAREMNAVKVALP